MALKDKVVVVTGGARGMGRAYVRGFLGQEAKVVAVDRSWEPTGFSGDEDDSFRREIQGNDNVLMCTADIADGEQVRAAYEAVIKRFGTVDILVNNAGMRQRDLPPEGRVPTLQISGEDFQRMYAVNVFGTLEVTRNFIQPMIDKRRGSIISVVSSGIMIQADGGAYVAPRPNKGQPYMSSKAALANMMFRLAEEVSKHNVAVNMVIPGHTRTTGFDEQNAARQTADARAGTQPVWPEHMVPLVLFLAEKDASSGITGRMFDVMTWNLEHGHGGHEAWAVPDYLERIAHATRG
jgi:1,1a-dihydroxy-1-hydro-9-fluorenone dehydrogenase